MTRWARSASSKASNRKTPEEATLWEKMSVDRGTPTTAVTPACPEAVEETRDVSVVSDSEHRAKVFFEGSWVAPETKAALENIRKEVDACDDPAQRVRLESSIKHLRRNEEKRSKRLKRKQCFRCRSCDHQLADCPNGDPNAEANGAPSSFIRGASSGLCYRCGSGNHTSRNCTKKPKGNSGKYPFASCFVCKEIGHISSECKKNNRGIYPHGGCCRLCGSVLHLRRDCPGLMSCGPDVIARKERKVVKLTQEKPKRIVHF